MIDTSNHDHTTTESISDSNKMDDSTLRTIGQGICGTVWASGKGPAYKREDGGPDRVYEAFQRSEYVFQNPMLLSKRKIRNGGQQTIKVPTRFSNAMQSDSVATHKAFP
ncbi:hypothetical protein N7533_010079 [Penicillium manginii]|uniref:uncharacterized protein n=1 Tax=Penicillium manginii TaxID=203109 RepID=UPI002546C3A7|nr:uncharacterized protein N7533_010079 [Penicillium manginii]KAJ5742977.1 hypothetical protein N7533_010079 [Penicillium manginii]